MVIQLWINDRSYDYPITTNPEREYPVGFQIFFAHPVPQITAPISVFANIVHNFERRAAIWDLSITTTSLKRAEVGVVTTPTTGDGGDDEDATLTSATPLPEQRLGETTGTFSAAVAQLFTYTGSGTVSYTAGSSSAGTASVSITSGTLTVQGVAGGRVTITITATAGLLSATSSFVVLVPPFPIWTYTHTDTAGSFNGLTFPSGAQGFEVGGVTYSVVQVSFGFNSNFMQIRTLPSDLPGVEKDDIYLSVSSPGLTPDRVTFPLSSRNQGNFGFTYNAMTAFRNAIISAGKPPITYRLLLEPSTTGGLPVVSMAIPNLTTEIGTALAPITLSNHFSDPDDVELEYTVTVVNNRIVSPGLNNGILTLVNKGVGRTNVTVQARDNADNRVSDTFTVTITAAPAVRVISEPSFTFTAINEVQVVRFLDYFEIPDGETGKIFSFIPRDAGIIFGSFHPTGTTARHTIQMRALAEGNTVASVTVNSSGGSSATGEFPISVILEDTTTVPDTPSLSFETAVNAASATVVRWTITPPVNDGDATIWQYELRHRGPRASVFSLWRIGNVPDTPVSAASLTGEYAVSATTPEVWMFAVRARNNIGWSAWTDPPVTYTSEPGALISVPPKPNTPTLSQSSSTATTQLPKHLSLIHI